MKQLRKSSQTPVHHRIDGIVDDMTTSEVFRNKLSLTLNKYASHPFNPTSLTQDLDSSIYHTFSSDTVFEAIQHLKRNKKDDSNLVSNHFIIAAPVIAEPLANLFSVLLRHGFLPAQLVNCVLVPIPKPGKPPSSSDSYRPIALASTLSKILEWCILMDFSQYFVTSDLQFGFKTDSSTSLCTGVLKQVVAKYIYNGSPVFACFLDASKAFDLVRHDILFDLLLSRGLPSPVVRLLSSWYSTQNLSVRWGRASSTPFTVSNGVRQGGVLSPVLFSIYLDELLMKLESLGVGCFWNNHFAGALAYADDIVLLAPSASALRILLASCESHGSRLGLQFNPLKTQLINFRLGVSGSNSIFSFCGSTLQFSPTVLHLGNKLSYDLCDDQDILLKSRYLSRAANSLFSTFPKVGPIPLSYLFSSYCLALYGCELWNLSSPGLKAIEVTFNKCLRRIWGLPPRTHTGILHCCAGFQSIYNSRRKRDRTIGLDHRNRFI